MSRSPIAASTSDRGRFLFTPSYQPSAADVPTYSATLSRVRESAVVARRLVEHALSVWRLDTLAAEAGLVVTELVANAVNHARGDAIRVTITRLDESGVHIGVVDKSRVQPRPRLAHTEEIGGRGLLLIDHMATTWGTDALPWGKRVWAEMRP